MNQLHVIHPQFPNSCDSYEMVDRLLSYDDTNREHSRLNSKQSTDEQGGMHSRKKEKHSATSSCRPFLNGSVFPPLSSSSHSGSVLFGQQVCIDAALGWLECTTPGRRGVASSARARSSAPVTVCIGGGARWRWGQTR